MRRTNKWFAGINAVLGIWLIIAPLVFDVDLSIAIINHMLVGGIIVVFSGYNAVAAEDEEQYVDRATAVSLLGLWVIAAPFILGFPDPVGFWNNLITGILIATVASYAAFDACDQETDVETRTPF